MLATASSVYTVGVYMPVAIVYGCLIHTNLSKLRKKVKKMLFITKFEKTNIYVSKETYMCYIASIQI